MKSAILQKTPGEATVKHSATAPESATVFISGPAPIIIAMKKDLVSLELQHPCCSYPASDMEIVVQRG